VRLLVSSKIHPAHGRDRAVGLGCVAERSSAVAAAQLQLLDVIVHQAMLVQAAHPHERFLANPTAVLGRICVNLDVRIEIRLLFERLAAHARVHHNVGRMQSLWRGVVTGVSIAREITRQS
jgi:hypothetical protein